MPSPGGDRRTGRRAPRPGAVAPCPFRGLEHGRRGVLIQHAHADGLDLVPDGRRPLELQLLGGGAHLRLELRDHLLDLVLAQLRQLRLSAP